MKLKVQPADGHPGCTYYMTLLQSAQQQRRQIRLGDFVYVSPSQLLLPPADCWMDHVDELDIYSVERLWYSDR